MQVVIFLPLLLFPLHLSPPCPNTNTHFTHSLSAFPLLMSSKVGSIVGPLLLCSVLVTLSNLAPVFASFRLPNFPSLSHPQNIVVPSPFYLLHTLSPPLHLFISLLIKVKRRKFGRDEEEREERNMDVECVWMYHTGPPVLALATFPMD